MKTQFLDYRLIRCRHPRLREALQFQHPHHIVSAAPDSMETEFAPTTAPTIVLSLLERWVIAALRKAVCLTNVMLNPVS